MKTYEQFAKRLDQLLGTDQCVRIHVEGCMPLVIEDIGFGETRQIALSHTSVQNGDLMRDPEIEFERSDDTQGIIHAEPISFRNDFIGLDQHVDNFDTEGKRYGCPHRPQDRTAQFLPNLVPQSSRAGVLRQGRAPGGACLTGAFLGHLARRTRPGGRERASASPNRRRKLFVWKAAAPPLPAELLGGLAYII